MTKGVVIFADSNEKIDYVKIAAANAAMINYHMNVPVHLITSNDDNMDEAYMKLFKGGISIRPYVPTPLDINQRAYIGYGRYEKLSWHNSPRPMVYDDTPFEETILIDADYLILDDTLNACWGASEEVLMASEAVDVLGNRPSLKERRLFDTNIPMSWATVVYFRRSERARLFFELVKNVKTNWQFYTTMFNVSAGLYRNDYAFSIAAHLMNDCVDGGIKPIPNEKLLTSFAADKIMKIRKGEIDLAAKEDDWHYPVKVKQNLHYMNKFDLNDRADEILEIYSE